MYTLGRSTRMMVRIKFTILRTCPSHFIYPAPMSILLFTARIKFIWRRRVQGGDIRDRRQKHDWRSTYNLHSIVLSRWSARRRGFAQVSSASLVFALVNASRIIVVRGKTGREHGRVLRFIMKLLSWANQLG